MTEGTLALRAMMAAQAIALAIWQALTKARLLNPEITEEELTVIGRQAAEHATKLEAMDHASAALNGGRAQAAEDLAPMIRGARYTSVLDKTSCEPCENDDTGELFTLDAPGLVHPPNPDCEGGGRCRCLLFYELKDEVQLDWSDLPYELRYNPNQKRDPGGEDGGQWVKVPGSSARSMLKRGGPRSERAHDIREVGMTHIGEHPISTIAELEVLGPKSSSRKNILGGHDNTRSKLAIKNAKGEWVYRKNHRKKQRRWLQTFIDHHKAQPQEKRHAVFMAGGPGSGKGYLQSINTEGKDLEKHGGTPMLNDMPDDAVMINADDIRVLSDEYKAMHANGDLWASSATHAEASMLAGKLTDLALAGRMNLVLDGVGDSGPGKDGQPSKFVQKLTQMKKAGYRVKIIYAHAPIAQARAQAATREKRSGRRVPPEVLEEGHREAANRFAEVAALDWAEIEVWDNSQKPPVLILQKADGDKLQPIEGQEAAIEDFYRKGGD